MLVVAPLRVVHGVWEQESRKWSHTQHLTFSSITGSKDQRTQALRRKADIYLTNYENLGWLFGMIGRLTRRNKDLFPFDGIVWDEVTKCKNSSTRRVKSVKPYLKYFKWRTGLTGSMIPNGYRDLHGQFLVVDEGKRLGTSKTRFRERYFEQRGFKDIPYDDTPDKIQGIIKDITLQMDDKDYLSLPELIYNPIKVPLPPDLKAKYDQLEKDFFIALDHYLIDAPNVVALHNKCFQFCNGAVYPIPENPLWVPVHDVKLKVLEEIIEGSGGKPVLVAYQYRSDADRIMAHFKRLKPINLTECKTRETLEAALQRWWTYDCPLMLGHASSISHGIDGLQKTSNTIVWFGLTYSFDNFYQFNRRLRRLGQQYPVICHEILIKDTLDLLPLQALKHKTSADQELRGALRNFQKRQLAN